MTEQIDPRDPLASPPPEAWGPLVRLAEAAGRLLERFVRIEAASGILLLCSAAIALTAANSGLADAYEAFWELPLGMRVGELRFERSLAWVVNDGLMVLFFFVVGLEIRREIQHGELSSLRRAALPLAAALGGMIVPALIYVGLAPAPATRVGWGVPMATDIAFALGLLALLGPRVPPALRVLLLALAVIDDIGAILVIAFFYSGGISSGGVLLALAGIALVLVLQGFGVRAKLVYVPPAVIAWAGAYAAGVHPTIAGVVVGILTPARAWLGTEGFARHAVPQMTRLAEAQAGSASAHEIADALREITAAQREALSPAESLIERLHPWIAYAIMPLFALANAGVSLEGVELRADAAQVVIGVTAGLVLGKPAGVLLFSILALRLRVATLPDGLRTMHLLVLGGAAGIGFTMSLFIGQLAFTEPGLLAAAKVGVLLGSGAAAVFALAVGLLALSREPAAGMRERWTSPSGARDARQDQARGEAQPEPE